MKPNQHLKKPTLVLGLAAMLLVASAAPSRAVNVPLGGGGFLNGLLNQFLQYFEEAQQYISQVINDKIQPLEESINADLQNALGQAKGVLGIPDPIATRKTVESSLSNSAEPINSQERATNEIDRQITRATASATLSQEGQQRTQEQLQITKQAVQTVQQQAQIAQSDVVTQNVMKRIAAQNAEISGVLGSMRQDMAQDAQRQELANVNLTNISRAIDGQNQAADSDRVSTGFGNLRIFSRARLF